MTSQTKVTGVILAVVRRDAWIIKIKVCNFFVEIVNSYSFNALRPIVDNLLINANRNVEIMKNLRACDFGFDSNFSGALAGILAAMIYSKSIYCCYSCDAPFITTIQLQHLLSEHQKSDAEISVACEASKFIQFFWWWNGFKNQFGNYLTKGERKVRKWLNNTKQIMSILAKREWFENINTIAELTKF